MIDLIGKELGPYRILEQIGIGGMATVYKAYHATMDRFVAVKVLPEQMGRDPNFRQRFEREAKAIAKLEHAHILPVHDYGEEKGQPYLVMRYIEAGTLKDRMAAGSMELTEASQVLRQVGEALAYAHRLGVVHRDVKPSNVLLDAQGDCYLTDFGLAKMMEASVQLTATGVGLGTPAYMSPEQGQGEKVDARSDIYSLGVMSYEMVTGRVPYEAETPMAVVLKHITAPLPLPREVKADVPPAVERVLLKALAKKPDDRFQTVEEMVAAFEAAVRLAEVETPGEVSIDAPLATETAAPPVEGFLARAVAGALEALSSGWGRGAVWAAGGILLLLALFFILSRIPLRVQISGGRVEVVRVVEKTATPEVAPAASPTLAAAVRTTATATVTAMVSPQPIATATPTRVLTLRPTATAAPTVTPALPTPPPLEGPPAETNELAPCEREEGYEPGLCIWPLAGGQTTQLLQETELDIASHFASWSPDGQRIVFSALEPGEDLDHDTHMYIVNADGTGLTGLPSIGNDLFPAWSPDGEWLSFHSSCDLAIMRPDGSDPTVVWDGEGDAGKCSINPQWSPDSQWIVFSVAPPGEWIFPVAREVLVISRDGATVTPVATITHEEGDCSRTEVAFSPDGVQVAYFDADCQPRLVNADGSGEATSLDEFPFWWTAAVYPQWGGSVPGAVPTVTPMREPFSISGQVAVAATSDALPGATVEIIDASQRWEQVASTTTDAAGDYRFGPLPAGDYYVLAYAEGYAREIYDQGTAIQEALVIHYEGEPITGIDFALNEGGSISGRVTGADGETPLANITVEVAPAKYAWTDNLWFTAISDADGTYRVTNLPLGEYLVVVESQGYQNEFYDDVNYLALFTSVVVEPPGETTGVDLLLDPEGRLSGWVLDDETGEPVEGAFIHLLPQGPGTAPTWGLVAVSNATGAFAVGDLPPAQFLISVRAEGYADEIYEHQPGWSRADLVTVPYGGHVTDVTLRMRPGGLVSGHLYDEAGAPLQGFMVDVRLPDDDMAGAMPAYPTGPHGDFSIRLPPGTYIVKTASVPGYVQEYYDDAYHFEAATPIQVTVGGEVSEIDFTLQLAGTISGAVYRPDGMTPVPDAHVFASPLDAEFGAGAITDANGYYRIEGLLGGRYIIEVKIPGSDILVYYPGVTDENDAIPIQVITPAETSDVDIVLPGP